MSSTIKFHLHATRKDAKDPEQLISWYDSVGCKDLFSHYSGISLDFTTNHERDSEYDKHYSIQWYKLDTLLAALKDKMNRFAANHNQLGQMNASRVLTNKWYDEDNEEVIMNIQTDNEELDHQIYALSFTIGNMRTCVENIAEYGTYERDSVVLGVEWQ